MNKNLLLSAAALGLLTVSVATAATADDAKCYGISKAGQNSCASANGSHSCKGLSKTDNDANDWVSLSADDCAKQGGKTDAPGK